MKTLNEALGSIHGEVSVAAQNLVRGLLIDTFNIIITPFDLFGEGRYCYTFHARCDENPSLVLEDGATRIFLNTRGTNRNEVSEELIQFLEYMEQSTLMQLFHQLFHLLMKVLLNKQPFEYQKLDHP